MPAVQDVESLPKPYTTPECDLRGYEFMPLFGHRLFGSEFYAKASDAEFRAAIKLWWAAWLQCPAGSLPNDDAALCRYADLGRDMRSWRKVREVALHGFVLCSDGRLYHKVLCEEANKAFERRRKERERKTRLRIGNTTFQTTQPVENIEKAPDLSAGHTVGQDAGQDAEQGWDIPCDSDRDRTETGQDRTLNCTSEESTVEPQSLASGTKGPKLSDPPWKWRAYFPHLEVGEDANTVAHVLAGKKGHNRVMLKSACELICKAARITNPRWRGDWESVVRWLNQEGWRLDIHILPAINQVASRPGYSQKPLVYFTPAIRDFYALHPDGLEKGEAA